MNPILLCEHCGEELTATETVYCDLCAEERAQDYADTYDNDGMTDAEADADTLRSAGMGTDEDYDHGTVWDEGMIGGDSDLMGEY